MSGDMMLMWVWWCLCTSAAQTCLSSRGLYPSSGGNGIAVNYLTCHCMVTLCCSAEARSIVA